MKYTFLKFVKMAVSVYHLAAVALTFVVLANGAALKQNTEQKIRDILEDASAVDQKEFIRYHLQKGHEALKKEQNTSYPAFLDHISEDESVLLYKYYLTNKLITDEYTIKRAQNIICWGNICLDISDPGVHP